MLQNFISNPLFQCDCAAQHVESACSSVKTTVAVSQKACSATVVMTVEIGLMNETAVGYISF